MSKKMITVEEFAENLDRFRIPLSSMEREKRKGNIPYYGAAKVIDYVDDFTHSGLAVLIAEDGSVETSDGYPVLQLADGKYWVNNHTHVLKGIDDYETKYLYYALHTIKVAPFVTGAVQKKISQKALNSMSFPYFDDKQVRENIVDILLAFDAKIQLNTQINQTLEHIAQEIFKSWFIDFDPVKAKAEAKAQGSTDEQANIVAMSVISGKSPDQLNTYKQTNPTDYQQLYQLAQAFPSEFEEIDGVEVPKGWGIEKIGNIAKIVKGKSYKSSELQASTTALVTLKSFNRGGGYRLDGLKEYSGNYRPEQEVFSGDLIIAYTDVTQAADVIGKPAMVMSDSRYEHLVISLDVAVVRPNDHKYKFFLYCLAMTDIFQAHTKSFCTGTTVLHLGKDAVPSFEFVNPDMVLIEEFEKFASPIFIRINNIIEENKSLADVRDLLLPKLLSGEVGV